MKLLTLKEAIELLNRVYQIDPAKHGRDVFAKGTIYNMISRGELKRYGPRHILQLDESEVLAKLGQRGVG